MSERDRTYERAIDSRQTTEDEAIAVLAKARAREDALLQALSPPPDYEAARMVFSKQKGKLTRAINSGDRDRVVLVCRDAVREWRQPPFNGAWPDDWSRWQRALDDVLDWRDRVRLEDL